VKANPDGAVPVVGALFLAGVPELACAATSCLVELEPDADLTQLLARVDGFDDEPRILALGALAERGASAAVSNALAALESESERVRVAGIAALGRLGDAEHASRLAKFTWGEGVEAAAARRALEDSSAPGMSEAILACLEKAEHDTIRAELIGCLVARRVGAAMPVLLRFAEKGGEKARAASLAGLEALAAERDLSDALALLGRLERPEDYKALESVLLAVCRRAPDSALAVGALVEECKRATGGARVSILHVLGELPSERTLAALSAAAKGSRVDERLAAVTALSRWPDSAPTELLKTVSANDPDGGVQRAAPEGYLRLCVSGPERPGAEILDLYRAALEGAKGAEAKRVVVECAGESGERWAVGCLEALRGDADVGELAAEGWARLRSTLARKVPHRAVHAKVTLEHPPAEKYAADGAATLTDGKWGSARYGDGRYLGFHEHDLVSTVDLSEEIDVREVRVGFLSDPNSWIFPPERVELALSSDGTDFHEVGTIEVPAPESVEPSNTSASSVVLHLDGERGRFLRVRLVHPGILPKWHPGSGEPAWMFVDELAVNSRFEP